MDQSCDLLRACPQVEHNPSLPERKSSSKIRDSSCVKEKHEAKVEHDTIKDKTVLKSRKGRNQCSICRLTKASKRSKVLYSRYSCPCDIDLNIFEEDDIIFLEYCDEVPPFKESNFNVGADMDEMSIERPESLLTILSDVTKERLRAGGEINVADEKTVKNPKYYLRTLQDSSVEVLQAFETNKITNVYYCGSIFLNKNNNKIEENAVFTETTGSEHKAERNFSYESNSYGSGNHLHGGSVAHTEVFRRCSSTERLHTAHIPTEESMLNMGHDEKQSNEWVLQKTSDIQSYTYFKARPNIRKSCTQLLCRSATGAFTGGFQITVFRGHRGKRDKIIAHGQFPEPNKSTTTEKMESSYDLNPCSNQQNPASCKCMRRNIHKESKAYRSGNDLFYDKHVSFSSTTMYFSYSTNDDGFVENQRRNSWNPDPKLVISERNNSNDTSFSHMGQQFFGKIIHVQGDGRCLFRSLVTARCPTLQSTRRDDYGRPERSDLAEKETQRADDLRASVVRLMKENLHFYSELGKDVLNADQPMQFNYKRFLDRLQAMTISSTMPGDLELNAAAMVLESPILVLSSELRSITTYGLDRFPQAPVLAVRYTRVVEDVGHYDAVILDKSVLVDSSRNRNMDDLENPFKTHIHQFSRLSLKDKEKDENDGGDQVVKPKSVGTTPRVKLQAKKEFFFNRDLLTASDRDNSAAGGLAIGSTHASLVSGNKDGGKEEVSAFAEENSVMNCYNKQNPLESGSKSFNVDEDMYEEDARFFPIKNPVKCTRKRFRTSNVKPDSKKITNNLESGPFIKYFVNTVMRDILYRPNNNGRAKRSHNKMQDSSKMNTPEEYGTQAKKARLGELTPKRLDTLISRKHKFKSKKVSSSKNKSKVFASKYVKLKSKKAGHQNVNENSKTQRTSNYSCRVFKGKSKRTAFNKSSAHNCSSDTGARFIAVKNKESNTADSSKYELTENRFPYTNNSPRTKEMKAKPTRRPLGMKNSLKMLRRRRDHQTPNRASRSLSYTRWNFRAVSQKRKITNFGGDVRIPKPPGLHWEFMSGKQFCFLCRNTAVCQGHDWLNCSMCHRAAHRECVNRSFPCWEQHESDVEYFVCQDCVLLI